MLGRRRRRGREPPRALAESHPGHRPLLDNHLLAFHGDAPDPLCEAEQKPILEGAAPELKEDGRRLPGVRPLTQQRDDQDGNGNQRASHDELPQLVPPI